MFAITALDSSVYLAQSSFLPTLCRVVAREWLALFCLLNQCVMTLISLRKFSSKASSLAALPSFESGEEVSPGLGERPKVEVLSCGICNQYASLYLVPESVGSAPLSSAWCVIDFVVVDRKYQYCQDVGRRIAESWKV